MPTAPAVLFLTHDASPHVLRAFDALRADAPDPERCVVLHDTRLLPTERLGGRPSAAFDGEGQDAHGYPMIGPGLIPGHAHFPVIDWLRNSDAPHAWVIEHDVRFAGRWRDFFARYEDNGADLVATRVVPQPGEPEWEWWDLQHPTESVPLAELWRAFVPVYRLSRGAADLLHTQMLGGWRGHCETIVPTLLLRAGLRVADIAAFPGKPTGDERFDGVPISCTVHGVNRVGKLRWGTFRYRPPRLLHSLRRGMLYHPVKTPGAWVRHNANRVRDVLGLNG